MIAYIDGKLTHKDPTYVIIDVNAVWCWGGVSVLVEDAFVECVGNSPREARTLPAIDGSAPFDFVEDCTVLRDQRCVEVQPLGESRLRSSDGFPVGWAEVCTEREADLEEQIIRQDVRECACHIGVMFYLTEAGFDVIGVDNDVVVGV